MEIDSEFQRLRTRFNQSLDFEVIRPTGRDQSSFTVGLFGRQARFLRVREYNPLLLSFCLMQDMHELRKQPELNLSPYGRIFETPGKPYNISLDSTVGIEPNVMTTDKLFDALVEISLTSGMRKLLPHRDDSFIETKLKHYYAAENEWETHDAIEQVASAVNENNLNWVMSCIPAIDPWADQDPDSVPGTTLIILDEVVRKHHRCISQARPHLTRIRSDFEKIGRMAREDILEVDALLGLISEQLN